jgi:hypothetical protein
MLLCCIAVVSFGQQVEDTLFRYAVAAPEYPAGKGSVVVIDAAHNNFHTAGGRYRPFANVLRTDGYIVNDGKERFTAGYLSGIKIMVISNATDNRPWVAPTLSAFSEDEIAALNKWVLGGGSLFLIADHMPMAGAASSLAASFGFTFYNGFAFRKDEGRQEIFTRAEGSLSDNPITSGRNKGESVDSIQCFTGQGFVPPDNAGVVMTLGENYKVWMPDTAWKFHDHTPVMVSPRMCNGAFMTYGKGRLVVFGEAAMFSAQLAGAKQAKVGMNHPLARRNPQLLLNIIHWLDWRF